MRLCGKELTHSRTMTPFDACGKEVFGKTLWEKEKLLVQAISPFPTMFFTLSKAEIIIFVTFNLSPTNAFNLVWSKILSCGNGLDLFFLFQRTGILAGYLHIINSCTGYGGNWQSTGMGFHHHISKLWPWPCLDGHVHECRVPGHLR